MNPDTIHHLFSELKQRPPQPCEDDPKNPAALPKVSLDFLSWLCKTTHAQSAFEFGSGQSTALFLEEGLTLTSIEDSAYWLEQTRIALAAPHLECWKAHVLPFVRIWTGLVPMHAWELPATVQSDLARASLVLIDSPLYTGFREAVLCRVLREPGPRLVVLDDARIPSIRRFCDRIAQQNPGLHYQIVELGHGFALFGKTRDSPLINRPPLLEIVKGWRRFLLYRFFLRKLKVQSPETGEA